MMSRILKYRELLLVAIIVVLIAIVAYRAPGFASPENLGEHLQRHLDPDHPGARPDGGHPDQVHRPVGRGQSLLHRHGRGDDERGLSGHSAACPDRVAPWPSARRSAPSTASWCGRSASPPSWSTLGTLTIYRGMAFVLSGGAWVNADPDDAGLPQRATPLACSAFLCSAGSAILVIAIVTVVFTRTVFGRSLYAAGGNPTAALYAGIDVGRTQLLRLHPVRRRSRASAAISGSPATPSPMWISRQASSSIRSRPA